MKTTRSRLLSSTVLPLAVVAAMGAATPFFAAHADSHEDGEQTEGCAPCEAEGCAPCEAAEE